MKRRILILLIAVIFIFTLLPLSALAADTVPQGYNEHDYNAVVNFLSQPSAVSGETNAQRLDYDISQPGTWYDVVWSDDTDKRLVRIGLENGIGGWNDKKLAGSLNLSNCTALQELYCTFNQLTTLDVSGCTRLIKLECYHNALTTLDMSANTALNGMSCSINQLTTLDVSGCTELIGLNCCENQLTELDVSGCTKLLYLTCNKNQLTSLDVRACKSLHNPSYDISVAVIGYTPPWLYWLCGSGLLVLAAVTARILVRRRRKTRNQ